jgi:hypothetical protein
LRNVNDIPAVHGQNFPIVKNNGPAVRDSHFSFLTEAPAIERQPMVRRRITPEAGQGLEKLAHALEYLIDEYIHDGCKVDKDYGRLQAIQLLAALNRQIYFACGVRPTIGERVQSLFRRIRFRQT